MLQATEVTNRKCRWHKGAQQEGMLKAERLLESLLCIVAPSRDSAAAVGNSIALIRIDRLKKGLVSDWDMFAMVLFQWHCACLAGPLHRDEQLFSSLAP